VVNTGLVAATRRPEELAGVLAHEIQHVELRHSLKGIIKHSGLSGLWMFATGDIGSGMAGDTATRVLSLRFSREAEREADTRGQICYIAPESIPAVCRTFSGCSRGNPVHFRR
jgi:predicted Zn-dependent protease